MIVKVALIAAAVLLPMSCAQSTMNPPSEVLVFAAWAPDSRVTNGPEPGFEPELTDLTNAGLKSASPAIDPSGTSWVINLTFTAIGSADLSTLTSYNVAVCPGDVATRADANCAQRHLSIWIDLTQADVNNWDNPTYVGQVSKPYDLRCLANATATSNCPKFVSDPITVTPITSGELQISAGFTQQTANDLANAIAPGAG